MKDPNIPDFNSLDYLRKLIRECKNSDDPRLNEWMTTDLEAILLSGRVYDSATIVRYRLDLVDVIKEMKNSSDSRYNIWAAEYEEKLFIDDPDVQYWQYDIALAFKGLVEAIDLMKGSEDPRLRKWAELEEDRLLKSDPHDALTILIGRECLIGMIDSMKEGEEPQSKDLATRMEADLLGKDPSVALKELVESLEAGRLL